MVVLELSGLFCFVAWGAGDDVGDPTNAILGGVIFICVVATCTLTYFQQRQTADVMNMFTKLLPAQTTIVRNGREQRIASEDLVIGDIVRLGLGDRVPADLRLFDCKDLKVEMSSMTGEPDAIACFVDMQHPAPAEARNLVFNSALVMNGEARGVVIRIGDKTMIGKIAGLASATTNVRSNMELEVEHFVVQVTWIAVATSIIFFSIGVGQDHSKTEILDAFINGFILVMIAYVPEGLPTTVASCMAIAAQRMGHRHVYIKRPDIIEALGAATVIASDKTGTLTQNKMTVENMWVNKGSQNVRVGMLKRNAQGELPIASDPAEAMAAGRIIGAPDHEGNIKETHATVRGSIGGDGKPSRTSCGGGTLGRGGQGGTSTIGRGGGGGIGAFGSFSSFKTFNKVGGTVGMSHVSWERSSPYMRLVIMAGVCNRARFMDPGEEEAGGHAAQAQASPDAAAQKKALAETEKKFKMQQKVLGDASDAALLRFVDNAIPIQELRLMAFPALYEIPFNSVNKWSMAVVRDPGAAAGSGATHIAMMKGAPEIILARCKTYLHNGREKEIDDEFRDEYQQAYERFAFMGERVLGFAYKPFAGPERDDFSAIKKDDGPLPKQDLCFLGLISLVDPPRDGVAEAVARCRSASIRVTMVTGDHPLTAEAIARKVGIITLPTTREVALMDDVDEREIALTDPRVRAVVRAGHEIKGLTAEQWDQILTKEECVFARTTPQQKLEIVENYQRLKQVVAVTGDGVNDSPALKKANIGVAMGSPEASDVAREAADIILMDDNFASIVSAIEEGRTLFDNLKKSIAYTIAHTIPELFPLILTIWFGFPLPLPGLIFLTIDLLTEQGPAISFAYEKAEDSVMDRPPRRLGTDRLVTRQVLFYSYVTSGIASSLVAMMAFFLVYVSHGMPVSALWMTAEDYFQPGAPDLVAGGQTFSAERQWDIYTESVSAYYATVVANQFWHVFVCKTRFVSIFEHGFFSNPITLGGCACELALAVFFVYVPSLQPFFFTNALVGAFWLCSLVYAAFIFTFSEWVKKQARERPAGWAATNLAW